MSRCQVAMRPISRQLRPQCPSIVRPFTSAAIRRTPAAETTTATATEADLDPNTVLPEFEEQLMKSGKMPIGSRRRRLAIRSTGDLPFEHLPYQAFQEARKILSVDREEKLGKIQKEIEKISRLEATKPEDIKGGQHIKDMRLRGLRKYVEELKILADANDPVVKKRFEDGTGDMNKPIYRHYAEAKWRSYDQRLINQRIHQFSIVPDVLPKLEPTADVQLYFRQLKVPPGQIVDSIVSEKAPRLRVQVFDKGERLVSIVVLDSDVPNPDSDTFNKRCHFLAANIPLSPNDTSLPLSRIKAEDQLALPWMPAFSQKGAPYHRLGIYLLEQEPGQKIDIAKLKKLYSDRDGFSLKSFRDKFNTTPFGFNMFRSVWDENTAAVMARSNIPGSDIEFRPTRVHSLKPPVKPRGWEAKRQGPKYRHLWKYTKNIKGISNSRGWIKRR
ncbi:hypothetical protein FPSE_07097 [Fusarium pseudograminearum CS3096]|uniref:Large ribosomal subunit protein mL38 n=1 Tax=Fusarium pseudograminearum (strain CS3096) TaxID=1028729 RepID=K3VEW6_FUSPC|nr:hypothetical protein FPSE_07097 [Fusarium pseudograminearum CS3096]EKJ72697.1 hypothetical protein FPSE_07097 [Fusarium pseudograminearum CS3096]KAF0641854.1 hypothetical protein FPSE5266_07097 [Fusarium pseudograminearum]